jgi:hypothetical protein
VHFAYENVLPDIKEKIMVTSYGETSGFAPVSGEELETVNGGVFVEAAAVVSAIIAGAVTTFCVVAVAFLAVDSFNKSK